MRSLSGLPSPIPSGHSPSSSGIGRLYQRFKPARPSAGGAWVQATGLVFGVSLLPLLASQAPAHASPGLPPDSVSARISPLPALDTQRVELVVPLNRTTRLADVQRLMPSARRLILHGEAFALLETCATMQEAKERAQPLQRTLPWSLEFLVYDAPVPQSPGGSRASRPAPASGSPSLSPEADEQMLASASAPSPATALPGPAAAPNQANATLGAGHAAAGSEAQRQLDPETTTAPTRPQTSVQTNASQSSADGTRAATASLSLPMLSEAAAPSALATIPHASVNTADQDGGPAVVALPSVQAGITVVPPIISESARPSGRQRQVSARSPETRSPERTAAVVAVASQLSRHDPGTPATAVIKASPMSGPVVDSREQVAAKRDAIPGGSGTSESHITVRSDLDYLTVFVDSDEKLADLRRQVNVSAMVFINGRWLVQVGVFGRSRVGQQLLTARLAELQQLGVKGEVLRSGQGTATLA